MYIKTLHFTFQVLLSLTQSVISLYPLICIIPFRKVLFLGKWKLTLMHGHSSVCCIDKRAMIESALRMHASRKYYGLTFHYITHIAFRSDNYFLCKRQAKFFFSTLDKIENIHFPFGNVTSFDMTKSGHGQTSNCIVGLDTINLSLFAIHPPSFLSVFIYLLCIHVWF